MDKKGVWRVIEAVAAVLIIAGAVLIISTKEAPQTHSNIGKVLRESLDEMARNNDLREEIVEDNSLEDDAESSIVELLKNKFPENIFQYNVVICDIDDADCKNFIITASNPNSEVFSEERLISASLKNFNPKIVRVYVWRK